MNLNHRRCHPIPTSARALGFAAMLILAACGGDGVSDIADALSGYAVERTEADGVETVRTLAGSRWGGQGRLVEDLSIGDETGETAYLFGSISDAWATEERIYVVDAQIPAVRAFDHEGNFLFDVGRAGQGPGEYGRPISIVATDDGRVLVADLQGARLNVFDALGNSIDDWPLGSPQAALGLQLTDEGEIYTQIFELPTAIGGAMRQPRRGMRPVGIGGQMGEPIFPPETDFEPPTVELNSRGDAVFLPPPPFTPAYTWALAPGGEMIAGVGHRYRFLVVSPGGRKTQIEKTWEPVPVSPGERAFRAEAAVSQFRRMSPDFSIPESDVPDSKPAFTRLRPDRSGRVWLTRQGPSQPDPACTEASGGGMSIGIGSGYSGGGGAVGAQAGFRGGSEVGDEQDCWANTYMFDVFELATGEFLGTVPAPEQGFRMLFVDGDIVLASVTDEAGTSRLKKYRLVVD